MRLGRFARYAWGVLGLNLGVILWGAFVRATGSGAGCGSHWPLCNGDVVPRTAQVETLIEFAHRATSGIALLAVVGLFLWARREYDPGHRVRAGATSSLLFIVIEALLGAGLVLFELVADNDTALRAFSMVAHLLNTFVLVTVLAITAWWASGGPPIDLRARPSRAVGLGVALTALAFVGATGAIAALGDTLYPSASLGDGLRDSFSSESHPLIQLRKYHPLAAVLVGIYVVALGRYLTRATLSSPVRILAAMATGLYVSQLLAGTVNIVLLAPVWLQLIHLLLADLLWIAVVLLAATSLASTSIERSEPIGPRLIVKS
ncbi:MAG: heme A synthase [Gemmatimonas sp.]|nr:heme A synthase [Gemmatimonas sp.]